MFLVATLPSRKSVQVAFIAASFLVTSDLPDAPQDEFASSRRSLNAKVNLSHCLYREDFTEPVSSYIIFSEATSSRTIVNHNALPEMTLDEFVDLTREVFEPSNTKDVEQVWFHFEGRNLPTTTECIRYLRDLNIIQNEEGKKAQMQLKISVELEKPGRPGLQELAYEADVIFYSRSWAQAEGHDSAEKCLMEQIKLLCANNDGGERCVGNRLLVCTWGAEGACAVNLPDLSSSVGALQSTSDADLSIFHSPAYNFPDQPIIDTTGAGDTFIAGALFGLVRRDRGSNADSRSWSLKRTLDFANGLAGRKI